MSHPVLVSYTFDDEIIVCTEDTEEQMKEDFSDRDFENADREIHKDSGISISSRLRAH
jgi:hypothetical protein